MTVLKKEKQRKLRSKRIKCSYCGSFYGYYRISTNSWFCRTCGNVTRRNIKRRGLNAKKK